ncbi:glycosyltransferase family 2 protein [Patescibacteria group bacterium]|nr:glycosyltransferase family 2 protein [Patescibacteria group bacterium]
MKNNIELSIIMPALNEEKTVGICVKKAKKVIQKLNIKGEVIVSDNGSSDTTVDEALKNGALVVKENKKGYGNTLRKAFRKAQGKYIIMADSDDTYDFMESTKFYTKLKNGYDLVMGDRYKNGKILKGATPISHRIGAPILTKILSLFYHIKISDAHCGFRGITREAYQKLHMQTEGMEFASEMIVKAGQAKLKVTEVPITLSTRVEGSEAKLNTIKDGWRHLTFLLTQGTNYLFIYPGLFLFLIGALIFILLSPGSFTIFGRTLHYHVLYIASMLTIIGYNILIFGILTKQYSLNEKLAVSDRLTLFVKSLTMNKILVYGIVLFILSILLFIYSFIIWAQNNYGPLLNSGHIILGITLFILSIDTVFAGFFSKVIELKK